MIVVECLRNNLGKKEVYCGFQFQRPPWLAGSIAFRSMTKQTIRAPSVWQSKAVYLMGSRKQREERDEDPVSPSEACPSIASFPSAKLHLLTILSLPNPQHHQLGAKIFTNVVLGSTP